MIAEDDKVVARNRWTGTDVVSKLEAAAGIFWNCDLEGLQPAYRGALGLLGESSPRARLGLGV